MLIKELTVENIRSYKHATIKFGEGSTVLCGDIGSGKSTLLLAIEFALFGTRKGGSLLRNGAREGGVRLTIEVNGSTLTIQRYLKKTSTSAAQTAGYYIERGIKTNATAIELKSKVLSFLHYPDSLITKNTNFIYTYTVYTPQEAMKAILEDNPDNRLDVLRKVFGFDKYKTIRENAAIVGKHLRDRQRYLEGSVSTFTQKNEEVQTLLEQLRVLEALHAAREKAHLVIERNLAQAQSVMTEKESQFAVYITKQQELTVAQTTLNQKREHHARFEKDVADSKYLMEELLLQKKDLQSPSDLSVDDIQRFIELKTQEHAVISQQWNTALERRGHIQEQIQQLQSQTYDASAVDEKKKELSIHTQALQPGLDEKISIVQKEIIDVRNRLQESRIHEKRAVSIKHAISALNNCPTCLQSVPEEHKRTITAAQDKCIVEYSDARTQLELALEQHQRVLLQLEKNKKEHVLSESAIQKLTFEIHTLLEQRDQYAQRMARVEKLQGDRTTLEQTLQLFENTPPSLLLQDIAQYREILSARQEYDVQKQQQVQLNERIVEYQNRLSALWAQLALLAEEIQILTSTVVQLQSVCCSFDKEEYERMKMALEAVKEEVHGSTLQKLAVAKDIEALRANIAAIRLAIDAMKNARRNIEILKSKQHWIEEEFSPLMSTIEKHILTSVYHHFNDLFQNWFAILMEDTVQARLDSSFIPVITQNGYQTEYLYLSGGERTSCALAYRLALTTVVNDIQSSINTRNIIILDEPTDGFSTEQLDKLRTVLDQLKMRQVIIVSHEPKIESMVDTVVRIYKEEHVSRVV